MNNKRLEMCAEFVSGKGIVCDVGTDHGYLAIELIQSGKCKKAIASDINENPLESARKNIESAGLSDKIELVLSDGLENVNLDNVTDIVIAGMGGETIINILEKNYHENQNLILQPMTKPELLRKWLLYNGYGIEQEKAVEDSEKIYTVILARYMYNEISLTEYESLKGFFAKDDEIGKKYCQNKAKKLEKIAESMKKAGKIEEAVHYSALSRKMTKGTEFEEISDIYNFLESKYPFALQEKWDNSGLLVDSLAVTTGKVLLTLDITNKVVNEAIMKKAGLIISHHPVIFNPLKRLDVSNPVFKMVKYGVAGICMHTNLDIAEGGTNTVIMRKIAEKFALEENIEPLEDGGLGYIITLKDNIESGKFAEAMKNIFGCEYVRMNKDSGEYVKKIAICSGSGGSLMHTAMAKGCDTLLTGDVKHDVWIDANNHNFTLLDCGHFHTENIVLWELRRTLEEKFPLLDVEIAENSVDPCKYI